MLITIDVPDEIARVLTGANAGSVDRFVLESTAIEGYRSGRLTEFQVGQLLGIEGRFAVSDFLLHAGVYDEIDEKELDEQLRAAREVSERAIREHSVR